MDDGGRPGVVRDGREMPGQARVMPHDVLMIRPEAHDFQFGLVPEVRATVPYSPGPHIPRRSQSYCPRKDGL